MKKNIIISLAFALVSIIALSQIFIIEKTNGNILELPVESIKEMRFKEDDGIYDDNTPDCVEIVDLGLSVNWATVNVGATAPEEYGYYVSWGELEEKEWYSWSYYKFSTSKSSLTKYNKTDKQATLEAVDDIATVEYGEGWRMTSKAEFTELFENCDIEYTANENGVNGIRLTSKVAGYEDKSIFIPAGGYKQDNGTMSEGSAACLRSNQCMIGGFSMPEYGFSVNISVLGSYETPTAYRYFGRNVRAVKEKTAE